MKSILIVDDNRDLADGLVMLLEDDFSVTTSYSGADALSFLAANDYDLILLDVELPDTNGMEVYCQIKGQKPDAVILMMTGYRIEQLLDMVVGSHEARILRRSSGLDEYTRALRDADKFAITLIVDDLNAATSIEEDFVAQGQNVYVANARKDVQEYIDKGKRKDALVLNLNESVMFGLKIFCDLVASDMRTPLVIVINDLHKIRDEDALYSLETTGCIFKPFDFKKLHNVINDKLKISSCA